MNKKVILSSILTLVLCVALIAGGTFALFTSESNVNIAVTSGKVEIVATMENLALYSPSVINADGTIPEDATNAATADAFVNGGTAVLDGAVLTLDKVTPGDSVTFDIKIENNSNVAIQYRTVVRVAEDNGLVSGLDMVIAGAAYSGETVYTNWAPLEVDSEDMVLNCSVELPAEAGNDYQDKTCKIVYTVEAVQGNTSITNDVARIGETGYATLEGALEAVQEGETVEILRPGTYAPFTVNKKNVTVKGIVGATKSESTVIKNTATENVRAFADGITLESLYIDSTTPQTINWMQAGAITPYIDTNTGTVAKDLTVIGCYLEGNGSFAILDCTTGIHFDSNTFEGFDQAVYAMSDNDAAGDIVITNNTFKNVKEPVNGYWGGKINATHDGVITITGNTFENDETPATIVIWDYAQLSGNTGVDVTINNNKGDVTYRLVWFDYLTATEYSVSAGTGNQQIIHHARVEFDIPFANRNNYVILNSDGTELSVDQGNSTLTQNINSNAGVYNIAEGDYLLHDKTTGVNYLFTVEAPKTAGTQQFVELTSAIVYNDEELAAVLASNTIETLYLDGDFGATTLLHGTDGLTIKGLNGATMASLNVNGAENVVIDSIAFDAASAVTVYKNPGSTTAEGTATSFTASIYDNRAFVVGAATDASKNITIKNCTFEGVAAVNDEIGYTAINVNESGAGTRAENWTVQSCRFNCNAVAYVYIQYVSTNIVIEGNTFGGESYSTTYSNVAVINSNSSVINVNNNVFYNWDVEDCAVKTGAASSSTAVTATVTGNTFNGTMSDNRCVIEIRRSGSTGHTVSGNTYNITGRTFDDTAIAEGTSLGSTVALWYRS